jgi:hypothetical protein
MTDDRRVAAQEPDGVTPAARQPATATGEPPRADPPADGDRPGDPVCLLRRVCPACGSVADEDPPTICPTCRKPITVD